MSGPADMTPDCSIVLGSSVDAQRGHVQGGIIAAARTDALSGGMLGVRRVARA
jgi:hypothetical protein